MRCVIPLLKYRPMSGDVFSRLGELKLIPVVAIEDASAAAPMGQALAAGGLP